MATQSTPAMETTEALLQQLETIEGRAQAAIDELLEEKKAVRIAFETKVVHIDEQVKRFNDVYKAASGRYYLGAGSKEETAHAGRQRRSKEEMQAEAREVVDFVSRSGKDGVMGGEIRSQFPKVGANIVKFVEANGGGKLTTTGQRASMKYYVE
jgi:hypothetical protein